MAGVCQLDVFSFPDSADLQSVPTNINHKMSKTTTLKKLSLLLHLTGFENLSGVVFSNRSKTKNRIQKMRFYLFQTL